MYKRLLGSAFALCAVSALILSGCGGSGGSGGGGGGGGGRVPLSVVTTAPPNAALGVPISAQLTATFNEGMDAATLTSSTFKASSAGVALTGTVGCVGDTATLQLDNPMPINATITATITTGARSLSGKSLSSSYTWSFKTGSSSDSTPPTVSSTDPANLESGVAINKKIVAVFSEAMAPATVNGTSFTLQGPSGAVTGTVSLLNNVATFEPTSTLAASSVYTATISTSVADLSGNTMVAHKVWSFTTGTNLDTTAPTVVSTDPTANEVGVPTTKKVTATFSEAMDPATVTAKSFRLKTPNGRGLVGTVAYVNNVATFSPAAPLTSNVVYTATITTDVKDTAGNAMAIAYNWSFTTASSGDSTAPTVISTNPADGATNVFVNASINATFSEAMQPSTINTGTFSVNGVVGTVSYDTNSHIATFKPSADLAPNTLYSARIETGAQDSSGNGMVTAKVWTFTTGTQHSQPGINMGAASTYAVLAGSTVTNSGPTVINGDLGVSPGTAVTGFPPGLVNGAIHAGDAAAAQAKSDLLAAQLDAAGRLGALTLPGDLSGLTFTPGLYKNSTSVMLSAGNVTLDAQGDANAVFIFQMGSTLTTSPGTQVILAGGAKASNIYWSVGTSATLGVNSIFKGVILADASITVNTGAVHSGTLLTKTGAVTLQANTVTRMVVRH